MSRPVTLNDVLKDRITKFTWNFHQLHFPDDLAKQRIADTVLKTIDNMGIQSSLDQNLSHILTSVAKLRNNQQQFLYVVKDSEANGGEGEVVGYLKVGYKHLYLQDNAGQTHSLDPPCVLDFFVLPSHQRKGYGFLLFTFMLNDLKVSLHDIAIDGPSHKMIQFIKNKFRENSPIRQHNNFAVFPQLFKNINGGEANSENIRNRKTGVSKFDTMSLTKALSKSPNPQGRPSTIADIIHGSTYGQYMKK